MGKNTKADIERELVDLLPGLGFKFGHDAKRLVRQSKECLDVISCNLTRSSSSLTVNLTLGVRFEEVERLFEAAGMVPRGGIALTLAIDAFLLQGSTARGRRGRPRPAWSIGAGGLAVPTAVAIGIGGAQ